MKLKLQTIQFRCNGYLANLVKCEQYMNLVGTESDIDSAFIHVGWTHGVGLSATKTNYHLCNKEKHVNPVTGQ